MDELVMNNYLMVLKSTVEVYVHGTLESSNKDVKELLHNNLKETISCQGRTYDEMVNNNWYNIENVDCSVINDTISNLEC